MVPLTALPTVLVLPTVLEAALRDVEAALEARTKVMLILTALLPLLRGQSPCGAPVMRQLAKIIHTLRVLPLLCISLPKSWCPCYASACQNHTYPPCTAIYTDFTITRHYYLTCVCATHIRWIWPSHLVQGITLSGDP